MKSSSLKLRLGQVGLLAVFTIVGTYITLTYSFTEGPDEAAHFLFTRFIAHHGRPPTTSAERAEAGYKSDLPPLFHLVAGWAGRGIDLESPPYVKIAQNNPRLQLVVGNKNILSWRAINTEDPYQGEVLLWYLGRWVALLGGALGLVGIYLLLRFFDPDHPWLALSGTAVMAFVPTYTYTSTFLNYESLLGAFLAFYFLLLLYTLKHPTRTWLYFGLGLLLGASILTKYTPIPALPVLPLLIFWFAYRHGWPWRTTLLRLSLAGLGLLLTFGLWFIFTEIYFNQIAERGLVLGLLVPFADASDETSIRFLNAVTGGALGAPGQTRSGPSLFAWAWHIFSGAWGGGWLAWLFSGVLLIAILGLIRRWPQADTQTRFWLILLGAHGVLFALLPLLRFLITKDIITGMGQHILFPAAAVFIFLLVYGLRAWLSPARLSLVLFAVAAITLGQIVFSLLSRPHIVWPIQTVPLGPAEQALATIAELTLLDYKFEPQDQTLFVTIQWRTEKFMTDDYQVEITLWDRDHRPQARWIGQPLNGHYPSRAWAPGDRVRDVIQLPIAGLPAGDYEVTLRLLGQVGPLPVQEVRAASLLQVMEAGDSLNLGQVTLAPGPLTIGYTAALGGQEIRYALWPQPQPGLSMPLFNEWATLLVATQPVTNLSLSLIGPDGQSSPALDQTGSTYRFQVTPDLAKGPYALRFERRAEDKVIDQVDTAPLLHIRTQERQFKIGPVTHLVEANFADHVSLLGYDLPQRRVQPGESLSVTLHWRALKRIGADLIMFNHLVDEEKTQWGSQDRKAHDNYSTMLWAPNEIVSDSYAVRVDPSAPDGIYYLLVGLYLPVKEAPVSLPLVQNEQLTDITNVAIGPIKVGQTPSGLTLETVKPHVVLNQPFGEAQSLTLLGYDLTDETNRPISLNEIEQAAHLAGQTLKLKLYWRSEAPLAGDYTTFVHLRNEAGEIVTQTDQPPLNGAYPTSLWDPGDLIADEIAVSFPTELSADANQAEAYHLVIGLYDFQTGQRLVVPDNPASEVRLTSVAIP